MLIKKVTYTDFEGVERTEDFRFNLNEAEVLELEVSRNGGLIKTVERLVQCNDQKEIVSIFKELILKAYGEKSIDGRRFIKSDELSKAFSETPAYSILFMECAQNADAAAAFINGIVPQPK